MSSRYRLGCDALYTLSKDKIVKLINKNMCVDKFVNKLQRPLY